MVEVPVAACADAANVKVLDVDPAGIEDGWKVAVTPAGTPEAESATVELNPPAGVSVIPVVALLPCATETDAGETVMVKLGLGADVQLFTRTEASTEPRPVA
jgi:hypothetical protein